MTRVTVSAASMRQLFRPCDPVFIAEVCKASCCRSTTDPTGIAVTVTDTVEADRIRAEGATVDPVTLRIEPVNRRCPFQDRDTHLCGLHDGRQPFGCVASPFTLSKRDTLIVRNRYRMLKCFKAEGAIPAYRAHPASLAIILGAEQAAAVTAHLDAGGGDYQADVPADVVAWLHGKNERSKGTR
jgi:Fe-S-cluster containining protein